MDAIQSITQRDSSFELLRLLSMFLIVLYHIFLFYLYPLYGEPFYLAVQMPLHIGVLLFVMISGYFKIKATPKGIVKLVAMMFIYYFPLQFLHVIQTCVWGVKKC